MGREASAGGRHWKQWREEDARDVLSEHACSGQSLTRFARERGVSLRRLMYWRKRLMEVRAPEFVAVAMPPAHSSTRDARIEVVFDGVSIHVREDLDVEVVARLAVVLSRLRRAGC